ncbi:MAG: ribose-phosphate pyrophosphokinase [Parvularculaceae bacterium]
MTFDPLIVNLPRNARMAKNLARTLQWKRGALVARRFPDGETYVRLVGDVAGKDVILVDTLVRPDAKFLRLIFAAAAARENGAKSVGLVAPYLAYMRQDRRFKPGEAVTSRHFAAALDPWIDWLVTVDPHLHRITALSEIYSIPAHVVHASPAVSRWIRENVENPLLIGPDDESRQWVENAAQKIGAPFLILEKTRSGDRDVQVTVPQVEKWRRHTPVLLDDIISTGRTMIETIGHLKEAGMRAPVSVAVHGVFATGAYEELRSAGAGRIATTNTITHESNAIDIASLLGDAIKSMLINYH